MNDIQEVFNRIKETQGKQKEIKRMIRDALESSHEYKEVVDKFEEIKERKKQLETMIQEEFVNDYKKLDAYKMHIKNDQEMLSDLAINMLVSGETVEVVDQDNSKYEPLFTVKFKKA
jgi:predicted nuclease with TOPRIM domain